MTAARVTTAPELDFEAPELLFEMPPLDGSDRLDGVTPDGQRFAALRDVNTETGRIHFNVVLNCVEELKARVPAP